MSDQPFGEPGYEVYIRRSSDGRFLGFSSNRSGGRFISRSEAIPYLRLDAERGVVVDSLGQTAGIGSIWFPKAGVDIQYIQRQASYRSIPGDVTRFVPAPNQEIIERQVLVRPDGRLVEVETSYGLGKGYDPSKRGGWWREKASEALGLPSGVRSPTRELEKAIVTRQFLVKTIS